MTNQRQIRINALQVTFSLVFLLSSALIFGQQASPRAAPTRAEKSPALCKVGSLPPDIQNRLKEEFGSWKIQESADLSPRAHARWEDEKPLECPGIAVGQFENVKRPSYAVLLVPQGHADAGYRFLIFGPKTSQLSYEMRAVDRWDSSGAANYFIHRTQISKFFDEQSRNKFHAHTSEGILLVDSAENEYGVEVYFWSGGSYRHEPIDY
jgi:hypothetical protein